MRIALGLLVFFVSLLQAGAHVVPNMTIEAEFTQDRHYRLRINLDPRVFLSDQPTSLPPITADWYLNQTDSQKQATHAQALEYLKENLGLTFDEQKVLLPDCEFLALDGATLEPVKEDTAETHLLATTSGEVPAGAKSYLLAFGQAANVSLILINSTEGVEERKPQVIFPGETSRPFALPEAPATPQPVATAAAKPGAAEPSTEPSIVISEVVVTRSYPGAGKVLWGIAAVTCFLFAVGVWIIKRGKRAR